MRYTVQFDNDLQRWVVIDSTSSEIVGTHQKLAQANRHAEELSAARTRQPADLALTA